DHDTTGSLTLPELDNTPLATLVALTPGGTVSATFPVQASFGGYTAGGDPTITVNSNAPLGASPISVVTNADFQPLLNFTTLTAGAFANLLNQLGGVFHQLQSTSEFSTAVPFVVGETVGDLTDFQKAYSDLALTPLLGPANTPKFHNAQTFVTDLAAALGV